MNEVVELGDSYNIIAGGAEIFLPKGNTLRGIIIYITETATWKYIWSIYLQFNDKWNVKCYSNGGEKVISSLSILGEAHKFIIYTHRGKNEIPRNSCIFRLSNVHDF